MAVTRFTLFLQETGTNKDGKIENQPYGWSESWWTDTTPDQWDGLRTLLAQKRAAWLSWWYGIPFVRVNQIDNFRNARVFVDGRLGARRLDGEPAQVAVLVKHRTGDGLKIGVTRPYRGLCDEDVNDANLWKPTQLTRDALTQWGAFLGPAQGQRWGWLGATGRLAQDITAIAQEADQRVSITTAAPLVVAGAFPRRVVISVSGLALNHRMNGQLVVTAAAADNPTYKTVRKIAVFPEVNIGRAVYRTKGLVLATGEVEAFRIAERKAGRPSFLSAGRRKAR